MLQADAPPKKTQLLTHGSEHQEAREAIKLSTAVEPLDWISAGEQQDHGEVIRGIPRKDKIIKGGGR